MSSHPEVEAVWSGYFCGRHSTSVGFHNPISDGGFVMKLSANASRKPILPVLAVVAAFGCMSAAYADDDEGGDSRISVGRSIAPVKLDLRGRSPAKVWLGSYIVNAQGGCNDCHTFPSFAPGGDPHQGQPLIINAAKYLAGGTPFGPALKSKNITPDQSGRPAGLTRAEFVSLMRTGRDPDNPSHILQVMPWPVYGRMIEHDLHAVYEYLSAIPSLPNNY
jgi:hypothetical protein